MNRRDLERWEEELRPLVPLEGASPFARQNALAFNADVTDARGSLLEAARRLLDEGGASPELEPCLERAVAELVFWRRVLLEVHREHLRSEESRDDFLVRYLLS
jgi:hypothetical protein